MVEWVTRWHCHGRWRGPGADTNVECIRSVMVYDTSLFFNDVLLWINESFSLYDFNIEFDV